MSHVNKKWKNILLSILIIDLITIGCWNSENQNVVTENFYRIPASVRTYIPEMVAPGIISTAAFEGHATLTPDGNTIYYAIYNNDHTYSTIAFSRKLNGLWQKPEIAPFSGRYCDGSPCLSPDGSRLAFSSKRPMRPGMHKEDYNIWIVEVSENGWGEPFPLNSSINTSYSEFSPALSRDSTLYFCSDRPGGYGLSDVYVSFWRNGQYQNPINLGSSINSEYLEGNVGVSADGSRLFIMVQDHPQDFGGDDIHFSLHTEKGWLKRRNLRDIINTYTYDFSPKPTPDGKYLYFSSRISARFNRNKDESSYTYDDYMELLDSPLNGFGNIYRIEIKKLSL
jgi:Tol biopolymer transport system component